MGPAQVAARLFEFGVLKRLHPLVSTRLALLMHPLGAAVLGALGGPAASVFALFHGAGNGLLTISRGTLPLALFGPAGYGLRTGIIAAPARVTTAAAPLLFGLLLNSMGTGLVFSTFVRHLSHANDGGPHRQAMEVKVANPGLLGALALPQGRATKAPPPS